MRLFDTHCHLDDDPFSGILEQVLQRAQQAGVERMVAVGTTAESSLACLQLARQHPTISAAVGIQPNYCAQAVAGDWDRIVMLAQDTHVVALGETGLDRYWDHTPFELQQDYFDRHLRLSQQTGLPFIVHMRDCETDVLLMLQEARQRGPLRGVMHSFTGSLALAEACLELGLYISFAGMVTFPKSLELQAIAKQIPGERLVLETDAPYLSPHPHRGQRPNEPALLVHTANLLAKLREVDVDQLAEQTTGNAYQLFQGVLTPQLGRLA